MKNLTDDRKLATAAASILFPTPGPVGSVLTPADRAILSAFLDLATRAFDPSGGPLPDPSSLADLAEAISWNFDLDNPLGDGLSDHLLSILFHDPDDADYPG